MLDYAAMTCQFTIFDTAIGSCGVAWGPCGVVGVGLPEGDVAKTQARLLRRCAGASAATPPPEIARIISDIDEMMKGGRGDLNYVALDLTDIPEFNRRVYEIARAIPPGETKSYGEIAVALGDRLLAREVGQALGKNPFPIVVPCHRVLAANGKNGEIKTGGFSAPGGVDTKLRMLSIERAQPGGRTLFDDLPLARKRG